MLVIRGDLVDAMVAHARADHPDEACGVIAGPEGSDRPERFIAMDQRRAVADVLPVRLGRAAARCGGRWTTPTRSPSSSTTRTPRTEAYPSRTDISYASEPDAHYVLVSTRDPDEHELRSYRIVDGVVTEEPVNIVEQY